MATSKILENQKQIFGQPVGLYILFFTEMWERFSFYGMKALLIFYLTKYHLFSDGSGNLLIGSYAALVYAVPVIGGFIADRYLGFRKAIVFGGVLLVLGHLGMAYEGNAATQSMTGEIIRDEVALQFFYFSLALIILGVGFLKANISSLVGELYASGDKRRDSGFTIFYMGINLGSFLATIICVWLGEVYGWSYGFGAAGVGMLLGSHYFYIG
jgi:POT family proton-dependent oligopeptide transporter